MTDSHGAPASTLGVEVGRAPRRLEAEAEIRMRSVGVDIGSATSQVLFSLIRLVKNGSRYVPAETRILYQSPILLTPYAGDALIDADRLRAFLDEQYALAGLTPHEVDAGSIICTGTALRKRNSRLVSELFGAHAGHLVAVSAGDHLESVLAAHGSGALALSRTGTRVLNVDVGGGTTKLALCVDGRIEATTALDVGARLLVVDDAGTLLRAEPAALTVATALGIDLAPGEPVPAPALDAISAYLIGRVIAAAPLPGVGGDERAVPLSLLRCPPLDHTRAVDAVTVSGGVSEFAHGRTTRNFGDLGPRLAARLVAGLDRAGVPVTVAPSGIRATVIGAGQFATQVSGNTIFLSTPGAVPVRNAPVLVPGFPLGEEVDGDGLADAITGAARTAGLDSATGPVAIALAWSGMATFRRLAEVARGIAGGLARLGGTGTVVLACDDDIGRLIGRHVSGRLGGERDVVSIDCIELRQFDFVDVGAILAGSGAVPVVIKSLVFGDAVSRAAAAATARPGA